jgi:hypothetical protein
MLIDDLYVTSRSNITDWKECPRLGFLSEDFDGQGYQLRSQRVPLLSGTHEHNALAKVLGHYSGLKLIPGVDPIETVIEEIRAEYSAEILEAGIRDLTDDEVIWTMQEQLTMLEGMTRGWVWYRLPRILDEYDVVEIERDHMWELGPGVVLPIKRDALLRRKADGMHGVLDFKGAPYVDDNWQRTHEHSDQTILYIEATEEFLGERTFGMIYEGLVRGQWRKDTAAASPFFGRRIQQTPYCYGYQTLDGEQPLRQAKYTAAKGWQKFRVADEIAGGYLTMMDWLDHLIKAGELPKLFITMGAPVNPSPEFRGGVRQEILLAQQRRVEDLHRFNQLREQLGLEHPTTQMQLKLMAPRNTNRCNKYGNDSRCVFADICTMPGGGLQQLPEDEQFKVRVPHHEIDTSKIIRLREVA